jgi:hypothetical protein
MSYSLVMSYHYVTHACLRFVHLVLDYCTVLTSCCVVIVDGLGLSSPDVSLGRCLHLPLPVVVLVLLRSVLVVCGCLVQVICFRLSFIRMLFAVSIAITLGWGSFTPFVYIVCILAHLFPLSALVSPVGCPRLICYFICVIALPTITVFLLWYISSRG